MGKKRFRLSEMLIQCYCNQHALAIINEINRDYALYNDMSAPYQAIADESIKSNITYTDRGWFITVALVVLVFPAMALARNMYYEFQDVNRKFMVHEVRIPFVVDDDRYKSPMYEFMFLYMVYFCFLYLIGFSGYDSFYGLSTNHACLKMKMYCKMFEEALRADVNEVQTRVAEVIKEQNRLYRFVGETIISSDSQYQIRFDSYTKISLLSGVPCFCSIFGFVDIIQNTFSIWLGLILLATMIQLCNIMYILLDGGGFDLKYLIFCIGSTLHIFLPCLYSAKLKDMSLETATLIYCGGWEQIHRPEIRRMVQFIIARSQVHVEIVAFNVKVFDMELFVSILQASYSVYTLLRS
ncbi:uncharacterized protein LOC110996965 [Pieris rapae]|uniref:uncharacterized protein LOC110996965 n=1 Tax=Pieris rapae TaxID=64459 RepID=UPI001E27FF7B|nr:uncharacterized protein LOC110996965 [Pieris rapae]